jgi:SNF2 family DNA or RNA helicase
MKHLFLHVQVVLNATMLRRTKNQEIDGKPIIRLPPRTIEQIPCEFDKDERAFYESLEARTNVTMNKFIADRNMMNMLILLLRLRQGACLCAVLVTLGLRVSRHT